jgi:hypothetical protein
LGVYMAFRLRLQLLFFMGVAIGFASSPLVAAPLEKEACDQLQTEKQSLVQQGVEKDMEKGPEWAKANLQPVRLDLVKRYIAVSEQLKFRCIPVVEPKPATTTAKAGVKGKKTGGKAGRADADMDADLEAEDAVNTGTAQKKAATATTQPVKTQVQPEKSPKKAAVTRSAIPTKAASEPVDVKSQSPASEGE